MTNTYLVGEHRFSIQAEEACLDALTNYTPFISSVGNCVFALHVVDSLPDYSDVSSFYVDSSDDDMPRIEISRVTMPVGNGWLFRESVRKDSPFCMSILTNEDFSEAWLSYESPSLAKFAIDNAAMLLYAFSTAKRGTLELHASVVVKEGVGYAFLGKSGTGKSTHSRMWLETFTDAWLLNDDNPVVRFVSVDGKPCVRIYGTPWSGKTPCYKNNVVPLGAFVKLTQAPLNDIHILRLPEAYAYVLSSASGLKVLPDMMDALFDTISSVIQTVPVFELQCLPNHEAAEVCCRAVSE